MYSWLIVIVSCPRDWPRSGTCCIAWECCRKNKPSTWQCLLWCKLGPWRDAIPKCTNIVFQLVVFVGAFTIKPIQRWLLMSVLTLDRTSTVSPGRRCLRRWWDCFGERRACCQLGSQKDRFTVSWKFPLEKKPSAKLGVPCWSRRWCVLRTERVKSWLTFMFFAKCPSTYNFPD